MIKNLLFIVVLGVTNLILAAEVPSLVADTNPYGAYPAEITSTGSRVFFASRDAEHGDELWVFDGQQSRLVADLARGVADFSPTGLMAVGGRVYFHSGNRLNGHQLWTSNGLATDTYPIFTLDRGPGSLVYIENVAVGGDRIFLRAYTGSDDGFSLWASNPTRTVWTKLSTGRVDHFERSAATADGRFYYLQFGPVSGTQLWVTDGTANGTHVLTPNASVFGPPAVAGGRAFFNATDNAGQLQTWTTDGTLSNTRVLTRFQALGWPAAFGNQGVFLGNDGLHGVEPWISDGTDAGTRLLADILPGAASGFAPNTLYYFDLSSPGIPTYRQAKDVFSAAGGRLFFANSTSLTGSELWMSDGTAAGTTLLKDLRPGPLGSAPASFFAYRNGVIFTADADDSVGRELWFSDGTAVGTRLLRDLAPGPDPSRAAGFALHGNVVFFRAYDGREGMKLWQTDGTSAGTRIVDDRFSASFDSEFVRTPVASGSRVFFTASDDQLDSVKLWATDGTKSSTRAVLGPITTPPGYPFNSPLFAYNLFPLSNGTCLWTPWHPAIRTELWFSDGSRENSGLLRDFSTNTDLDASAPGGFVWWQGGVYLAASVGLNQFGRFRLQPETLKLESVDFQPLDSASGPWVSGDAMYFVRRIASSRRDQTGQLVRINRLPEKNLTYAPNLGPETFLFDVRGFTEFQGHTYFNVSHALLNYELWRTAANGAPIVEKLPLAGYISGVCNNRLLIDRTSDLAAVDAQGNARTLFDNSGGASFRFITSDRQHAWVSSTPSTGPHSLWVTDGTLGGTRRVREFPPGSLNRIDVHALASGVLWFAVVEVEAAAALWRSDGTVPGTRLVMSPARPGSDGGLGGKMTVDASGRIYFTARDPLRGMELFTVAADASQNATPARLVNLAVRARAPASGEPITAGFVLRGVGPATTLARSAGPALAAFGVTDAATDPTLTLYRGEVVLAMNDDWQTPGGAGADPSVHSAVGAFPFAAGSRDAALLQSLTAGAYVVQALAQRGSASLTEVFHASDGVSTEFVNLSCRHLLAAGDDNVIAGFTLAGVGFRRILIRAVGPGLQQFGLSNVCADPILELRNEGAIVATNDNWAAQADRDDVDTATADGGAFRLEAGGKDAAVVRELPIGAYSIVVRDRAALGGEVLVELYVLER